MSSIQVREVNVVPVTKIKKEILDDEENEDTVLCRFCSKAFVSELAVRNHARMEHIKEFMDGQDLCVKRYTGSKRKYTDEQQHDINVKTSNLISSMQPTAINSLASKDVSYIIIKKDSPQMKKMRKVEKEKPKPKPIIKKKKDVEPISGPFECLQPSSHNPEVLCHQMFLSCCDYSSHYRDEHTRRRKGNRCQVCEKPIAGSEQLTPYSCQICGMCFENTNDLTQHSQTAHIKLKPFQCAVCLKRFTQQGGLQQHMRMHTGDRPFPCTFCPKAFTQKSGLDQHLRIHTKVKPYRCVICGKSFCQSVHLQQHMRTHTNVAPFQCGICQKRFKQSSHLNYHLKYHNMGKMTDEQKEKYTVLMSQMLKQEFYEVEIDQSEQVIDQSEVVQIDESQENSNQSVEIDQSDVTQGSDHSDVAQEVEQSQQTELTNEEASENESYFVVQEDEVWCEGVVCEQ